MDEWNDTPWPENGREFYVKGREPHLHRYVEGRFQRMNWSEDDFRPFQGEYGGPWRYANETSKPTSAKSLLCPSPEWQRGPYPKDVAFVMSGNNEIFRVTDGIVHRLFTFGWGPDIYDARNGVKRPWRYLSPEELGFEDAAAVRAECAAEITKMLAQKSSAELNHDKCRKALEFEVVHRQFVTKQRDDAESSATRIRAELNKVLSQRDEKQHTIDRLQRELAGARENTEKYQHLWVSQGKNSKEEYDKLSAKLAEVNTEKNALWIERNRLASELAEARNGGLVWMTPQQAEAAGTMGRAHIKYRDGHKYPWISHPGTAFDSATFFADFNLPGEPAPLWETIKNIGDSIPESELEPLAQSIPAPSYNPADVAFPRFTRGREDAKAALIGYSEMLTAACKSTAYIDNLPRVQEIRDLCNNWLECDRLAREMREKGEKK